MATREDSADMEAVAGMQEAMEAAEDTEEEADLAVDMAVEEGDAEVSDSPMEAHGRRSRPWRQSWWWRTTPDTAGDYDCAHA